MEINLSTYLRLYGVNISCKTAKLLGRAGASYNKQTDSSYSILNNSSEIYSI